MDPNDATTVPPQRSRWTRTLTCPHCHREFDYDLIPGASVTAVRLGTSRYMRCPLCQRFARFDLSRLPGEASGSRPRFSDRRTTLKWSGALVVPAIVLLLAGVLLPLIFSLRLTLVTLGTVVLVVSVALLLAFGRPERSR